MISVKRCQRAYEISASPSSFPLVLSSLALSHLKCHAKRYDHPHRSTIDSHERSRLRQHPAHKEYRRISRGKVHTKRPGAGDLPTKHPPLIVQSAYIVPEDDAAQRIQDYA